ncbi:methyltransferase domain-containing protein [Clostridium peptidivorans]|uniref:methyltransferase domain-containing protein n=1 Tax=Clostridium peptidivorans TaxID=100174 RepID=UPI000BE3AB50|nr:methyltransferase domain-containing protein [Clostridium peptidivorans]
MKAIILNAGKSSKMENILKDKPKCLLEIEGNSLLEIQINTLYNCGIDNISVVRGYNKKEINIPGIKYYDNDEYENTNVLYSLFCAKEELNDDVIILYGDILFEEDTIKRMLDSKENISIGVMINKDECFNHVGEIDYLEKEMLVFDAQNNVELIGKGLNVENKNTGIFTGIIKCNKKGINVIKNNYERIKETKESNNYLDCTKLKGAWITELLNEICQFGVPLHCVIIERGWMEIDTEKDYYRAIEDNKFVRRLVKVKTDWAERSNTYDKIKWVNRNETLDCMIEFAGDVNDKNVLDIGTGTGKVLKALKEKSPQGNYYGVDISKEMMEHIDRNLNFKLLESKIENLDKFENDSFDIVTARMVIHHSENLEKAFSEVKRVLKPGGKFIICEGTPPNRWSIKFYEEMFKYKEDRHTFLLDDLTNLYINTGFENITSRTIVLSDMSLNNWLKNAGVPYRNVDIIRKMHYEADRLVKEAYRMEVTEDDIIMNWKFAVICGSK